MRLLALALSAAVAVGAFVTPAVAQADETADTAFDGFRMSLVEDLDETRTWLATATQWVNDPDWYLVETPDVGVVGVELSRLPDHAALLADPSFAARVDVLDDPVHAWDDSFTMSLSLIRYEGGDPVAAAERLASSLTQTPDEKRALLRLERQYRRADRDELTVAIDAFDAFASGLGLRPAVVADTPTTPERLSGPLDHVIAFRDELVADREALQARVAACRTAIDEEDVVAFGEQEVFKFGDELRLSGVVVFDLPTLPDYASFPAHLRDDREAWDYFDTIFAPEAARESSLLAAMLLYSFWQDWPPGMRGHAQEMWPIARHTAKEDRALCRPLIGLLRPERDRLDAAIAALDEYFELAALDAEPTPRQTVETVEPVEGMLGGCWQGPIGHGTMWAQIDQAGDDFNGRTVSRWQWGSDAEPMYALGSVSGDIRSGYPTGLLHSTGPFDGMYSCAAVSGGTNYWGSFSYWDAADQAYWLPCDQRGVVLVDPNGDDYAWALPSFGFERVLPDVCLAAFAEAEDRG